MIRSVRLLLALALYASLSQPAPAQQDRRSANMMVTGCQYLVDDPIAVTQQQMEAADVCASAVAAILNYGRDLQGNMAFCPPRGSKAHPDRMNERFDLLSYGALRQAWPCRH